MPQQSEQLDSEIVAIISHLCDKYPQLRSVAILVDDVHRDGPEVTNAFSWGRGKKNDVIDIVAAEGMLVASIKFHSFVAEAYANCSADLLARRRVELEAVRKRVADLKAESAESLASIHKNDQKREQQIRSARRQEDAEAVVEAKEASCPAYPQDGK